MATKLPPPRHESAKLPVQSGVFSPPAVTTGDLVRFSRAGVTHGWKPAVVLAVEATGLSLAVITAGSMVQQVAVLHVDDPRQNDWKRGRNGTWDITEREREFRQRLDAMAEEIRVLRAEVASKKSG